LEPITHFLTGACLSRAGFNRKTALATTTMTLAAEAPDLDVLGYIKGPVFGFAHHRGITHTLLGVPFVAAFVVLIVYGLYHWKYRRSLPDPARQPRWGWLFALACVAVLSHILLDFTNNYGVRPFSPFYPRWYSWDIVFIVEPMLWLILIFALVMPRLFGLIHEEIGARERVPHGRGAALAAFLCVLLVWGVRDYEHRHALAALEARTYKGAVPLRVSAVPYWVNPFKWMGIVETRDFFVTLHVDSLAPEVDPDNEAMLRYKPEETPATLAAKKSYLGRVYLDWAGYPVTETETLPNGGYLVHFFDLRFLYPERKSRPLGAVVELDPQLHVLSERMGVRRSPEPGN
jgi:inner membrane protein